jgi:hypothetical protein
MSIYVSYYLIKVSIIIDKGKEYTTNNQCSNINIIPYEIVKYLMRLPCPSYYYLYRSTPVNRLVH